MCKSLGEMMTWGGWEGAQSSGNVVTRGVEVDIDWIGIVKFELEWWWW